MAADQPSDGAGPEGQGGDVEARLAGRRAVDLALALDDDDIFQPGPVMAFAQPFDIMDHSISSCFDAPVLAVERLEPADRAHRRTKRP